MLPYFDENPAKKFPFINICLIAANIIIYVLLFGKDIVPYSFDPNNFKFYTLVTSMFIHAGFLHLIGNMFYLYLFGDNVENAMGQVFYLIFYISGGIISVLIFILNTLLSQQALLVGASGAISAVMGAYIVFYPRVKIRAIFFVAYAVKRMAVSAFLLIGFWFLMQLWSSTSSQGSYIAYWAHIGGFIYGAGIGFLYKKFFISEQDLFTPEEKIKFKMEQKEETEELKQENIYAVVDNKISIIESLIRENKIEEAKKEYIEMERFPVRGALVPDNQLLMASSLEQEGNYIIALQAYMRFLCNYPKHLLAVKVMAAVGLLFINKFNNIAVGFSYIHRALENADTINDENLLGKTRKAREEIAVKVKNGLEKLKIADETSKYVVLTQIIDEDLLDSSKICKALMKIGEVGGINLGWKLRYNFEDSLSMNDGIILKGLTAPECMLALEKLESIEAFALILPEKECSLNYLKTEFVKSARWHEAKLILQMQEDGKDEEFSLDEIEHVSAAQFNVMYLRRQFSSELIYISAQEEADQYELSLVGSNVLLDMFSKGRRLRFSSRDFQYLHHDAQGKEMDFEVFVEDLIARIGGNKLDENVLFFVSNRLFTNLSYKNVFDFNKKSLWIFYLNKAYRYLFS